MRRLIKGLRKMPEVEITICWGEEGVSFVRWRPRDGGVRAFQESVFLKAELVSTTTYRESLSSVTGKESAGAYRVSWAVLEDAFPHRNASASPVAEAEPDLPDWIEGCWKGLELSEIPKTVLSGLKSMQKELGRWSDFAQSGTGICLQIGQRILFLGQGNGISVHRLSRKGLASKSEPLQVTRDWLLQTRLIFRNRTAAQLRRVHIPSPRECSFSWEGDEPFEIIPGFGPPEWVSASKGPLESGLLFLHTSILSGPGISSCRLTFSALEKRRRLQVWERRLRAGSCLLLGGWSFLLLGACRHDLVAIPESPASEKMQSFRSKAYTFEQTWRTHQNVERVGQAPYRLVGAISESVPEGVELSRIQVKKLSTGKSTPLQIQVEGLLLAGQQKEEFRHWIDHLQNKITGEKLMNLRFERNKDRIHFSLQGNSGTAETSR